MNRTERPCMGVIGLGYVGLPLACAFSKAFRTIGFDIDTRRIGELKDGLDRNGETTADDLENAQLAFTSVPLDLVRADVFVVTVPTPTTATRQPDLGPLMAASRCVGEIIAARRLHGGMRSRPIVVFESTVYPGCTEGECAAAVAAPGNLVQGIDFSLGYSPERINPGDREHDFASIVKVVSGDDDNTLDVLADIYGAVVAAGVHRAPSIRVAEAAKVIENTQRDVNIALMNELAILFHRMGIDTTDVLEAARTKWNFLPFYPGLVGGHCIPEDPYYLTHVAAAHGMHPQLILSGRRTNDSMSGFIADEAVGLILRGKGRGADSRILLAGLTFKENVPDCRNSRSLDIIARLEHYGFEVHGYDPFVDDQQMSRLGVKTARARSYDCVILAVPHAPFRDDERFAQYINQAAIVMDLRGSLDGDQLRRQGSMYWRL